MAASAMGAIPGKFLVDVFPWLKYVPEWFPGAGFQRQGREWKALWRRFTDVMFETAEEHIVSILIAGHLACLSNFNSSTYGVRICRPRVEGNIHMYLLVWRLSTTRRMLRGKECS